MPSFKPRKLSPEEFTELEQNFLSILNKPAEREALWQEMHAYFNSASAGQDREYWTSFFRWYTSLTWISMYNSVPREAMVKMGVGRQVPMALLLGFDVWDSLLSYFELVIVEDKEIRSEYIKMREAFIASPAVLGVWQGKTVTVADLVQELKLLNSKGYDSLSLAEELSKVKQLFFPTNNTEWQKYFGANPDTVVDWFVGLVNFFLGVEPENIASLVKIVAKEKEATEQAANSSQANAEPTEEQLPTNEEIIVAVDAKFAKDGNGQYKDMEGVLDYLSELSVTYNDPSINDIFYFDEKTNRFEWVK